jgi:hypothetical protein
VAGQCVYCGSDLRPSSMFCLSCGQLVVRSESSGSTPSAPLGPPPGLPASSPSPRAPATAPNAVVTPVVTAVPQSAPAPAPTHATATEVVAKRPPASASAPPQAPAASSASGQVWLVSGAQRVLVEAEVLVGRRPDVPAGGRSLTLNDGSRTVSRTHVAVRRVDGVVSVTDLGSSNGTYVDRQGTLIECPPHTAVSIGHGDVIHVGDVAVNVQDS